MGWRDPRPEPELDAADAARRARRSRPPYGIVAGMLAWGLMINANGCAPYDLCGNHNYMYYDGTGC